MTHDERAQKLGIAHELPSAVRKAIAQALRAVEIETIDRVLALDDPPMGDWFEVPREWITALKGAPDAT